MDITARATSTQRLPSGLRGGFFSLMQFSPDTGEGPVVGTRLYDKEKRRNQVETTKVNPDERRREGGRRNIQ
jgi:hypothetical protein